MKLRLWLVVIFLGWVFISYFFIHSSLLEQEQEASNKDRIKVGSTIIATEPKAIRRQTVLPDISNKVGDIKDPAINSELVEGISTNHLVRPPFVRIIHTNEECGSWFDYEYLKRWNATSYDLCSSSSSDSYLSCRHINNPYMPVATRPQVFCDAGGLSLHPEKMVSAPCVKHRPSYFCGEKTYNEYKAGAFSVACASSGMLKLKNFPRDHLMDNFDAMAFHQMESPKARPLTALLITRERGEHVNMYHATSDFFNAYLMVQIFNLDLDRTQVVLLDNHSPGPLDEFLKIFSPKTDILRASRLADTTTWERAIFSPPGYSNIFLSQVTEHCGGCCEKIQVVEDFANFVLGGFGIPQRVRKEGATQVLLITRRSYRKEGVDHSFIGRQFSNEDELVSSLQSIEGTQVTVIDFAGVPLRTQLVTVAKADIVVGMHGAGLTHVLWLPPWGALVELFPKTSGKWHCFRHIALWRGLRYESWTRTGKGFRKDANGDYTTVDVDTVKALVERLHKELPTARTLE